MRPALAGLICFIALSIASALKHHDETPYDSTDSAPERSGLILYTDSKTNLQYLSSDTGGLTPRLNPKGHHMKGGD